MAQDGEARRFKRAAPALYEYARSLEDDAQWLLAVDVYVMLGRRLGASNASLLVRCHLRLGWCYRYLSMYAQSGAAFERARSLAIRRHDLAGELLAVIGQARLVTIRGNQPASEFMLLSVLDRARRPGLGHVRSRALHDLGGLAARRNEFGVAVRLAYEAYGLANEDAERDRILGDIGSFFLDMRILDAARDAHMVVRAQAREQYTRWVSCLNLLDIESQCGYRERFDDLTLFLKRQDLPPELRTGFLFNYGQGLLRFGELAPGGEHLRRALAMASEYGLNRYVLEVEELLTSLHQPEAVNAAAPLDCDVAHVAQELGKLRASLSS